MIRSNISAGQFLMIAQFVSILIGVLKKADNGAVAEVVDKLFLVSLLLYSLKFFSYLSNEMMFALI